MPKPGGDLAELDLTQLLGELAIAKDTHFKLRLRNATGQLDNTAEMKRVRRHIARINTFIRQREIEEASRS